ncbi:PREDICTED: protein FAR-RED IMPAIRED RESPONSE 1-like [Erythranthe guttata]|uniref:protein FAR-RED IMPAIRED RESPONSE 1-like n=1 Tax=Erythranthe guttata TaxID=4155 RepID=UPI00064D7EDD|nr:PREDICTED: protein FAR-RED IMPAIRED RESPONSE 1-like [Erythranthe guttata]|eukprot:XP_012837534.1 PREDICTED: protein FAR-RED IMPAIRED RESPONSE 1-like [Erythranthe guttata]
MDSSLIAMMEELLGANSENNFASTNEVQSFGSHEVEVLSHHIEAPSTSNIEDEVEISSNHTEIPLISSVQEGPTTGTLYPDIESLFRFYLEHAKHRGFGVIKRTTRKTADGENKYLLMTCDKSRKTIPQKTTKRVDCPARVNTIKQCDGSWMVSTVVAGHNHELTPDMSILIPARRNISTSMKRQLEANDIAGIRPCKSIRLAEVQSGGPMNLGCLPKDCRNFIEGRRKLRLGTGDAEAIRKLFWGLQKRDTNFIYSLDIDDHGRLCNMLWIHSRCRAAYAEFNDVLTFDTTYLVNKYKMPFATIVGINHHGQSILLGCALVIHEDAESFKWFFKHWLEAMDDVHPKCIVTDQCESIKIAIRELMPGTIHRYCLWHIMSKVPQKFKGVAQYNNVVRDFKRIVYESITSETFELKWSEFFI